MDSNLNLLLGEGKESFTYTENTLVEDDQSKRHDGRNHSRAFSVSDSNANTNDQQGTDSSPLVRACQLGDFRHVNKLITSGKASAMETSSDGVTPLHWAAINNRLNICKYLLDQGAAIDVKGGSIQGTPLHWACRNGLVYIAHLLISRGADPLRTDSQGFNALHLAVHSSNVLLVIYLLHLEMPIDPTDNGDRTPLHWAAYQGDALTVDALLNWGADTKPTDEKGFTPLHWAIVKGNKATIKRLIEGGYDVFALSVTGKSPRAIAEEMKTLNTWESALKEMGRDPFSGALIPHLVSLKTAKLIMFFSPYLLMFLVLKSFALLPAYISIPISLATVILSLKLLAVFIIPIIHAGPHAIMQSPIFSGLFSGTAFLMLVHYILYVFGSVFFSDPFTSVTFLLVFGVVAYSFFASMFADPGYIPPLGNVAKQRTMIEGLIESGEYDTRHFCISTYVRKPLRSRYDRIAKRVVAKYDHYCPWVYNVVGVRNHRVFLVFVLGLAVGIPMYIALFLKYVAVKNLVYSDGTVIPDGCSAEDLFGGAFCHAFFVDLYGSLLTFWIFLNGIWVYFLFFVQMVQVAKGMTTNEASNLHKYGYMGSDDFSSLPSDHSTAVTRAQNNAAASSLSSSKPRSGYMHSAFRLLGIDQFLATAKDATSINLRLRQRGGGYASISANPADLGAPRNCVDFWFPRGSWNPLRLLPDGSASFAGNPIDYYRMWDFPMRDNSKANAAAEGQGEGQCGQYVAGDSRNGILDLDLEREGESVEDSLLGHNSRNGSRESNNLRDDYDKDCDHNKNGDAASTAGLTTMSKDASAYEMVSKS